MRMAIKVTGRALAKGMLGAILGYMLYNLNQPILEALLMTDLSVTWISFILGLYNVASMGGIIVVNATLGTITPDMVADAKKTGEEINQIADRKIEKSPLTDDVIKAKDNLDDHGDIYDKEEEVKEEEVNETLTAIEETIPEPPPEPVPITELTPTPEPAPVVVETTPTPVVEVTPETPTS